LGDGGDWEGAESFWSRMQVELLDRHRWKTRLELANAIFDYLEIFHNRQRRHSVIGWLAPAEFENRAPITVAQELAIRLHVTRHTPRAPIRPGARLYCALSSRRTSSTSSPR